MAILLNLVKSDRFIYIAVLLIHDCVSCYLDVYFDVHITNCNVSH